MFNINCVENLYFPQVHSFGLEYIIILKDTWYLFINAFIIVNILVNCCLFR